MPKCLLCGDCPADRRFLFYCAPCQALKDRLIEQARRVNCVDPRRVGRLASRRGDPGGDRRRKSGPRHGTA